MEYPKPTLWVYEPDKMPKNVRAIQKHEALSPELTARAKAVWRVLRHTVWWCGEDGWLRGFLSDDHPDREIEIWEGITADFRAWLDAHPHARKTERRAELRRLNVERMKRYPVTLHSLPEGNAPSGVPNTAPEGMHGVRMPKPSTN